GPDELLRAGLFDLTVPHRDGRTSPLPAVRPRWHEGRLGLRDSNSLPTGQRPRARPCLAILAPRRTPGRARAGGAERHGLPLTPPAARGWIERPRASRGPPNVSRGTSRRLVSRQATGEVSVTLSPGGPRLDQPTLVELPLSARAWPRGSGSRRWENHGLRPGTGRRGHGRRS